MIYKPRLNSSVLSEERESRDEIRAAGGYKGVRGGGVPFGGHCWIIANECLNVRYLLIIAWYNACYALLQTRYRLSVARYYVAVLFHLPWNCDFNVSGKTQLRAGICKGKTRMSEQLYRENQFLILHSSDFQSMWTDVPRYENFSVYSKNFYHAWLFHCRFSSLLS